MSNMRSVYMMITVAALVGINTVAMPVSAHNVSGGNDAVTRELSPLKQIQSGIAVNNVLCNVGLHLIIKTEDGSPACVKPTTANILIERGWATSIITTPLTVQQTSENNTLPTFTLCDTPFPQNYTGIAVLYMPVKSTGKICVKYSNPDSPEPVGITFFDANNIRQNATGITTWNDSENNTISKGNSTVVYWIKTGNQTGFYGLAFYCGDWKPLAVGYDSNSNMTAADFPFLRETMPCPFEPYHVQIDSLTGIGVKHIP